MLLWEPDVLDAVDEVVTRARSGLPSVLVVEGEPGTGKTSLLDELADRAGGFHILGAEGIAGSHTPYAVLRQWGVNPPQSDGPAPADPFVAAQSLRRVLDEHDGREVLLRCDDLQWADAESVEATMWLLRRALGDRLLVVVGSRPLTRHVHPTWQRWSSSRNNGRRLVLSGLSKDHATELVRRRWPTVREDTATALWEHTGGNPLYLRSLLEEYDLTELTRRRVLPAPAEFADLVMGRVHRLPPPSVRLLEATTVMSPGWSSLVDVAVVAGLDGAIDAIEPAAEAALLDVRHDEMISIRIPHSLIRAALYEGTPLRRRQELHRRLAEVTLDPLSALEHRVAAVEGADAALAEDLEDQARRLHAERAHRGAARFWRNAADLSPDRSARQRRWLESLFDSVLAGDFRAVQAEQPALTAAGPGRASLVLGVAAVLARREVDGIPLLTDLVARPPDALDPLTRYRAEVLLAWAQIAVGYPPTEIDLGIQRFQAMAQQDEALTGFVVLVIGGVDVRLRGVEAVMADLHTLSADAARVPLARTFELAWRGSLRCRMGFFAEAVTDLTEVVRRIQDGAADFSGGVFHAFLARALWMTGDWPRSHLNFRLALEITGDNVHSLTLAMAPVGVIATTRLPEADRLVTRADAMLRERPWQDQAELLLVTRVILAHASVDDAERRDLLSTLRAGGYDVERVTRRTAPWLLHAGLAGVWAADPGYALRCADELDGVPVAPDWTPAAAAWLRGLAAEAELRPVDAETQLTEAVAAAGSLMPLYRAHLLRDLARVRPRTLDGSAGREADALYERLGATPYLARGATVGPTPPPPRQKYGLTEREQDVLTLLLAGMSYAQIGQELFITRHTVGYHLGNMYAKCGVTSRHDLADEARRHPADFGLQ